MAVRTDPHVLVVAGSDSSGGAGVARDVETVAAFGLRACLAVTAVTVQTHDAVRKIEFMPPDLVAAQMRAAFESNPVAAVKIGLLGTQAIAEAVTTVLAESGPVPVVLDPVLAASSGRALTDGDMVGLLQERLLPLCHLVTPNLPELALLTGTRWGRDEQEIFMQAGVLLDAGAPAVLVKGGHAQGDLCTDLLIRPNSEPVRFEAPRLGGSTRGTGCMLASATAACLALGASLDDSVQRAKQHVFDHIGRAVEPHQFRRLSN